VKILIQLDLIAAKTNLGATMNGSTVSSVMEVSNPHHYQPSKGIYLLTNSTSTSSLNYQLLFSTCNHQEANLAAGLEASVMPH
jgi:hypothetical protein